MKKLLHSVPTLIFILILLAPGQSIAQFTGGSIALSQDIVINRVWHLTNKMNGHNLKASGSSIIAVDHLTIESASWILESVENDAFNLPESNRWFHIRVVNSDQYVTVDQSGGIPRAVTLTDYDPGNEGQLFRLIATGIAQDYKLRFRLSNSGPDLVLEINQHGILVADSPKLDPSSEQKFYFNLQMPTSNQTYVVAHPGRGRFLSNSGRKSESFPVIQQSDIDESVNWQFIPLNDGNYHIRNKLTGDYLTAWHVPVNGTPVFMNSSPQGNRSRWSVEPQNHNFRIRCVENTNLFISATDQPSGEAVLLRFNTNIYINWMISPVQGEIGPIPGNYNNLQTTPHDNAECFFDFGSEFKKAVCERVGLSTISNVYEKFEFIKEMVGYYFGSDQTNVLLNFDLDDPGHRVDLVLLMRQYVTEVVPVSPSLMTPNALLVIQELNQKVSDLRVDYGNRLSNAWQSYVMGQGNNITFSNLVTFWLNGNGFVWPEYYLGIEQREELFKDYFQGAASLGYTNNVAIGGTAIGLGVVTSSIYVTSTTSLSVLRVAIQGVYYLPKLFGLPATFPIASFVTTAAPPATVAAFAAATLAVAVMDGLATQEMINSINSKVDWCNSPVNILGIFNGENYLERVRVLNDLDYLLGAPVNGSFLNNTNDNYFLTPFTFTCPTDVTVNLDENGTANLETNDVFPFFIIPACGGPVTLEISENTFTCEDLTPGTTLMFHAYNNALSVECPVNVHVFDNIAPQIQCPNNQTIYLDEDCSVVLSDYTAYATVSDNCSVASITQNPTPGTIYTNETTVNITLTVTDQSGNSSECSFQISVEDNIPPTITCPANQTVVLNENCSVSLHDYTGLIQTDDNCGIQSLVQVPAPQSVHFDSGLISVTFTVTDIYDNQAACSISVEKVDETPPSVLCFDQDMIFNGETSLSLDYNDLVDADDNCGIQSITLSAYSISCHHVGDILPILVTVTDINNNTSTCTSNITVGGLPCGWSQNQNGINCQGGSQANYYADIQEFELISTNCFSMSNNSDQLATTGHELCGDGTFVAHVSSIYGNANGWAGISLRESNAPGSRKVELTTNKMSNFNRRTVRTINSGPANTQNIMAINRHWLKIERSGNQFAGYCSPDGSNWFFAFAVNIPMSSCLQAGLILSNYNANSTVHAHFNNVQVTQGIFALPAGEEPFTENHLAQELSVYPNPTGSTMYLRVPAHVVEPIDIQITDITGKIVSTLSDIQINNRVTELNLHPLKAGMYLIRVATASGYSETARFTKMD